MKIHPNKLGTRGQAVQHIMDGVDQGGLQAEDTNRNLYMNVGSPRLQTAGTASTCLASTAEWPCCTAVPKMASASDLRFVCDTTRRSPMVASNLRLNARFQLGFDSQVNKVVHFVQVYISTPLVMRV